MFYSITNIAILSGIIFAIILLGIDFITYSQPLTKRTKYSIANKILLIFTISLYFSILVYMTLYMLNHNQNIYLEKYMNYTELQPVEYFDSDRDCYTFYLIYEDGSKIKGNIIIENEEPFKSAGKLSFFLTNYDGELLWSDFRIKNKKRIEYFKNRFVDKHKDKWLKFKKNGE